MLKLVWREQPKDHQLTMSGYGFSSTLKPMASTHWMTKGKPLKQQLALGIQVHWGQRMHIMANLVTLNFAGSSTATTCCIIMTLGAGASTIQVMLQWLFVERCSIWEILDEAQPTNCIQNILVYKSMHSFILLGPEQCLGCRRVRGRVHSPCKRGYAVLQICVQSNKLLHTYT